MTNNNLTDERLSVLIRVARDSLELYEMELPVIDDVMLALAELQQRRAAMLQGAVQPQNQQQNIPENIPVNTPCKEAPQHIWLQTAGVWPENGEFSELTWCSDNQHEDDTLYVRADVVTGNSPVIPDGSISAAQFVRDYCKCAGWTEKEFYETQVPLPDNTSPSGWSAVTNSPLHIKAHVDLYMTAAPQQEVK